MWDGGPLLPADRLDYLLFHLRDLRAEREGLRQQIQGLQTQVDTLARQHRDLLMRPRQQCQSGCGCSCPCCCAERHERQDRLFRGRSSQAHLPGQSQPSQPTQSESAMAALRVVDEIPTMMPPPYSSYALPMEAQPPGQALESSEDKPQQLPVEHDPGSSRVHDRCTPPHLAPCPPSPTVPPIPTEPPPLAAWAGRRACAGPGGKGGCNLQVHSSDAFMGHCCNCCLRRVGARYGGWHGERCEGLLNYNAIIAGRFYGERDAMRGTRIV